jgi:hypothetical protein
MLQVMSARFDQEAFWDSSLYSLPQTELIGFDGNYSIAPPLEVRFTVCQFLSPLPFSATCMSISWNSTKPESNTGN